MLILAKKEGPGSETVALLHFYLGITQSYPHKIFFGLTLIILILSHNQNMIETGLSVLI